MVNYNVFDHDGNWTAAGVAAATKKRMGVSDKKSLAFIRQSILRRT